MTRRAGFTVIEVIAVLAILCIVAAIAIAKAPPLNMYHVAPEAEVIKGHLRYAQTRSMDTTTVWGINFASGSYTLFNSISGSNPLLPGVNSATATLPAGMSISTGIVSFDTWGTPYTDTAATVLQSAGGYRDFNLTLGSSTVVIQISDNTGFIP
jgi:MSHA pilin protein MshC